MSDFGDSPTPPLTGNPYSLRRPGQSRLAAFGMWAKYLFNMATLWFVMLMVACALAYPVAAFILFLRIRAQ